MQLAVLVALVGGFAVGIGIGTTYSIPTEIILVLLVVSFSLGVIRRRCRFSNPSKLATHQLCLGVIVGAVALGLWRAELAEPEPSPLASYIGESVTLSGVVVREPDRRESQQLLYLETDTDRVLVTTDKHIDVAYGDRLVVAGILARPENFQTELGRTFNYTGYLLARGVEYRVSFADVSVVEVGQGNVLLQVLYAGKDRFTAHLEQVVAEPYVGLGEGLLLGEKRALGAEISEQFQRTGLTHIVVLSGYNVMLVAAFCLFIFSFLFGLYGRMVAGLVAITVFALLVGPSATVVRASIMAGLVLVAQATGRRYDVLRALLFAATIMLLLNPYLLLYDIGFQLSFMATLGLVLFAPDFESTVAARGITTLRGFFVATLVTQIAVLPLLAYHIGQISIISVVANVLVLPVVPAAMLASFITGVIALLSTTLALPVSFLAVISLGYILFVTDILSGLPFAAVVVPAISPWLVIVWYALYSVLYWWWQKPTTANEFADWEIVEEATITKTTPQSKSVASQRVDEPPVFFR